MLDRARGKVLQSTRSVKLMQKDLTPSEQFWGMIDPTAVSREVMALETTVGTLALGIGVGIVGTEKGTPRCSRSELLNCMQSV